MTQVLVDTSVIVKWFHHEGEGELAGARAIRDAHIAGLLDAYILDLALYELGNVLSRSLRWPARDVADQLDDVLEIFGTPLSLSRDDLRNAALLASTHSLTFCDAAWASSAEGLAIPLVSADLQLLASHLAESPAGFAERLRLPLPPR